MESFVQCEEVITIKVSLRSDILAEYSIGTVLNHFIVFLFINTYKLTRC